MTTITKEWVFTSEDMADARKLVALRDAELPKCPPRTLRRIKIEKKIRQKYRDNSDNMKHLRNGRIDQIPKETRDAMFTPFDLLEKAYYENYKPRAERDDSTEQQRKRPQTHPTRIRDDFYGPPDSSTDVSTVPGTRDSKQSPTPASSQQYSSPPLQHLPSQLAQAPSTMMPGMMPFFPQAYAAYLQTQPGATVLPQPQSYNTMYQPQNWWPVYPQAYQSYGTAGQPPQNQQASQHQAPSGHDANDDVDY